MRVGLVLLLLTLAACGSQGAPQRTGQDVAAMAAAASPTDPRLAALYQGSCRNCHAQADSGAPLTQDRAAWDPRWSKGQATLFEHTVSGFNGMPAGGQCFTCTADDYTALIAFMAGREE